MHHVGPYISPHGLEEHDIRTARTVYWNLTTPALIARAIRRTEGRLAHGGPLVVRTGPHTGRAAKDKFVVKEPSSDARIWWGDVNKPFSEEQFNRLHARVTAYLQGRDLHVQDCFAGADPKYRLHVRVVNEDAWHNLFARTLFIHGNQENLKDHKPEFTILHCPHFHASPEIDGTRSDAFVIAHFGRRLILIGGTAYAGEMKKSIFTVMNYLLPQQDVLSMHCSANIGPDGETAIFFGLSGTGKTTLSADASRTLIGDDEHGWSDDGIFNFEGGCYAKVIRLSPEAEPEIYATTKRFGTILENVAMDPDTRYLDLDDDSLTENTRAAYPITHIPNATPTGRGGHPKNVLMLTADAFGVLPPVARLTREQAMYHFMSGYTAKLAGTEAGLGSEPAATFSACFGAPFMALHPAVYAKLLGQKIVKHDVDCWLVNTGWTGGPFGTGHRMPIMQTRAMVNAVLDGTLRDVETREDPVFGLHVPISCPGVDAELLTPRATWADPDAYDKTARDLAAAFHKNFLQYADEADKLDPSIKTAGPLVGA